MKFELSPESWLSVDQIGHTFPSYKKTFLYHGDLIDAYHRLLETKGAGGMLKGDVEGNLRQADALKLYEMAFFSNGDILELGTFSGLSASIMAAAVKNAGTTYRITSVDLHDSAGIRSKRNLTELGLEEYVTFVASDGSVFLQRAIEDKKKYGFVFIDHDHSYEHVHAAARLISSLILAGGFVLFHDFNDCRNFGTNPNMRVCQGVQDGLERSSFEFAGIYGCTALYRAVG